MSSSVRPLALALTLALAAPLHAADTTQATNLERVEVSESTLRLPRSQGALPMTITGCPASAALRTRRWRPR